MKLIVFTGKEDLYRIGEVAILYDRIVHIDFNFTGCTPTQILTHPSQAKKIKAGSRKAFTKKTCQQFSLRKLSKADIPYRDYKLTHAIDCDCLRELGLFPTYIRLTRIQSLRIGYNTKSFFWQSPDFKKSVYKSIGNHIVLGLVSLIGAVVLLMAPWKNKQSPTNKSPTETDVRNADSIKSISSSPVSVDYNNSKNPSKYNLR
jgi:hypothetical protein